MEMKKETEKVQDMRSVRRGSKTKDKYGDVKKGRKKPANDYGRCVTRASSLTWQVRTQSFGLRT